MMQHVNPGKRVAVSAPHFEGLAGLVQTDDATTIALPGSPELYPVGSSLLVDGGRWVVQLASRSAYLRGYITLAIEEAA